jgi:hypothetical protein
MLTKMNLSVKVNRGRFHVILPKEYPKTFPRASLGTIKKLLINNEGQSDIVTHKTNASNNVTTMPKGFFTTLEYFYFVSDFYCTAECR